MNLKSRMLSCSQFPWQTTNLAIIAVLFRDQCGRKTLELVRSFSLPLFHWNRRVLLFNSYENALPTSTTRNPDFSLWRLLKTLHVFMVSSTCPDRSQHVP
jgi:hypothetical protein